MSENISQSFKNWMIATGKSKNTANTYSSGVNTVSNHLGRDVFGIDDLSELERLYRLYGPKGEHAEIGASNSGSVQSGLKQWLEYQRQVKSGEALGIDPVEGRKQWESFLVRWPLEKLRALTLEHYYGAEGDDSFYSWLRDHTPQLGDFKEGILSAGVRLRGGDASTEPGTGMQSDGRHIWYSILGNSAQEAFDHLKRELLTAVDAVRSGDLSPIAGLKNAPGALLWKVAFLYQDQARPLLLPFYSHKRLKWVAGTEATGSALVIQQQLMGRRGEQELLAFAAELERQAMKAQAITKQKDSPVMAKTSAALNQILFGPPGTGKTHATIEAALAVLDPVFLAAHAGEDQRQARKQRFDELVAERLVRFVTFHQSFSYEDFVEGLRAHTEEGKLTYEVEEGVFKAICSDAAARVTVRNEANIRLEGRRIWKMSLGNTLGEDAYVYDECIANNYILLGYGDAVDYTGCSSREEILRRFQTVEPEAKAGDFTVDAVDRFLKMKKGDLVVVSDGNFKFRAIGEITGDYRSLGQESYGQCRDVKWLRVYTPSLSKEQLLNKQFSQATIYELKPGIYDKAKLQALLSATAEAGERAVRPHVLIIDEINRGNVSRIFGELITLIEPSKRAGAAEALSVVLPYSKESFSVPDNVYLIGTMNTADRSLAGLDIALRRRFVFQEMPPQPELLQGVTVEGINIGQLLSVLNQRIEVLLDRDHCLGHAYFLPLKQEPTFARLADLFRQQILPLLQEYFFEDWERIRWVLNDHEAPAGVAPFIRPSAASTNLERLFGSKAADLGGITRWELNPAAFESVSSFRNILGQP